MMTRVSEVCVCCKSSTSSITVCVWWNLIILSGKLGQFHGHWCPGSLYRSVISKHGVHCDWHRGFQLSVLSQSHDDVIKWKYFPRYWPFVRGIRQSPVNSPHKGLWRGALMFSLICVCINGWVNNREAGDLRRYLSNYDATAMLGRRYTGDRYILFNQRRCR